MARIVAAIALSLMWCALTARIKQHADFAAARGTCQEAKMIGVCNCNKRSMSNFGAWQCSECIDTSKWGYGCRLNCPEACPDHCDFSGNCQPREYCPENCKRNSRVDNKTEKDKCVNSNGLCQACEDSWYGEMCTQECPSGCEDSVEGKCMRDGACYSCQEPFYGPRCEERCPEACPKCMMEAGQDDAGEQVPAGSCLESCRGDKFGRECSQDCPENCDRTAIKPGKPSCTRNDGTCKKCAVGWHGAQCKEECKPGCVAGECRQDDGVCVQGCKPGFWGKKCDQDCPEFTVTEQGCDREDGFPKSCDATHYPSRDPEVGTTLCAVCPEGCQDGECDDNGQCTKGCVTGKHGKFCSEDCPDGCDEALGCSRESGQCNQCKPGLTGLKCSKSCHSQCATCKQFVAGGLLGSSVTPGNGVGDCLACPGDDASEMLDMAESCQCIAGSARENANAQCMCQQPEDPLWEARFETNPKKCATHCKENYNGEALRPVSGLGTTKCIPQSIYNAVASMWSKWYSGPMPEKGGDGCDATEYKIEDEGKSLCLHREFVEHIAGKENFDRKGV